MILACTVFAWSTRVEKALLKIAAILFTVFPMLILKASAVSPSLKDCRLEWDVLHAVSSTAVTYLYSITINSGVVAGGGAIAPPVNFGLSKNLVLVVKCSSKMQNLGLTKPWGKFRRTWNLRLSVGDNCNLLPFNLWPSCRAVKMGHTGIFYSKCNTILLMREKTDMASFADS